MMKIAFRFLSVGLMAASFFSTASAASLFPASAASLFPALDGSGSPAASESRPVLDSPQSQENDTTVNVNDLQEVTVLANVPYARMKGSAIVMDVAKSPLGDLPTTADMLSQLPGVKAGDMGGYTVSGRGSAVLYIGNRKVQDMSEIERLQPTEIKSIEIIRNPGVEYDADAAAVIKIILKNKFIQGLGANLRTQERWGRRFSDYEQLSLTYGARSLNAFLTATNNSTRMRSDQTNHQNTYAPNAVWKMTTDMPKWNAEFYDWTLGGGLSGSVAENHTLGARLTYSHDTQRNSGPKYITMEEGDKPYEDLTAFSSNPQGYEQWLANAFYEGTLSDKTGLYFNADYINRRSHALDYTEEEGNLTPQHVVTDRNNNRYDVWSSLLKLNWTPLQSLQLNFGADFSYSSQKRENLQNVGDERSSLHSVERKYGVFAEGSMSWQQFTLDLGVRFEANNMDYTDEVRHESLLKKTACHVFPQVTFSAKVGETKMALSFNSRIRRPTYYQLRSSREYFNKYETTTGNPLLQPTYTYDLSYSFQYRDLTANAGFRWVHDAIAERNVIDSENPLHVVAGPYNKPHYTAFVCGANYNKKVNFWTGYFSANLTKTFYSLDRDAPDMPSPRKTPYIELSATNYFTVFGTTAYVECDYNPSGLDCNEWEKEFLGINVGLYRRFFNRSLYIGVEGKNIFASKRKSVRYYNNSTFERISFYDSRRLTLNISYTFRYKPAYKGRNAAQDELNRM